jgi:hypothetical protein
MEHPIEGGTYADYDAGCDDPSDVTDDEIHYGFDPVRPARIKIIPRQNPATANAPAAAYANAVCELGEARLHKRAIMTRPSADIPNEVSTL